MNLYDFRWVMTLFGTAVGAAIIFLPLKAGAGGIFAFIGMIFVSFPLIYLSHRALYRYCSGGRGDIGAITQHYFGAKNAYVFTTFYTLAFLPECISYAIGLVNAIMSLLQSNFSMSEPDRLIVTFIVVSSVVFVMYFKPNLVMWVCQILVIPLCLFILGFSLYMIPYWNYEKLDLSFDFWHCVKHVFLALPILVFAFQFSPAISTFKQSILEKYGDGFMRRGERTLMVATFFIIALIMFFVFSSLMCLSKDDIEMVKQQNISVLSYFAQKYDSPSIMLFAPSIVILAAATSFFGPFLAAREGIFSLFSRPKYDYNISDRSPKITHLINLALYLVILAVVWANPNVLNIIESIVSPIIVAILFILPVIGLYKAEALKKYQNKIADGFVFFTGIFVLAMSVIEIYAIMK